MNKFNRNENDDRLYLQSHQFGTYDESNCVQYRFWLKRVSGNAF